MREELILPSIYAALHARKWKYEKPLEVALSAIHIKMAYGAEALREWKSFFILVKKGGVDASGQAYVNRWKLNEHKLDVLMQFLKDLGRTVEDLPHDTYPPQALLSRVEGVLESREKKRRKRLNKQWAAGQEQVDRMMAVIEGRLSEHEALA
ncbi:MAG: hypothetical protein ABI671_14105 [Burkholderiales bacterium]